MIAAEEATRPTAYDVRDAKGQYIPSFRLSSGYSWANQDRSFSGGTASWNLNLSLSLPIFNGFTREGTLERAQFAQRLARLQEDDARLAARQQADGALQDVRTAEKATVIAEEALRVPEEDLRPSRSHSTSTRSSGKSAVAVTKAGNGSPCESAKRYSSRPGAWCSV